MKDAVAIRNKFWVFQNWLIDFQEQEEKCEAQHGEELYFISRIIAHMYLTAPFNCTFGSHILDS